MTAIKWPRMMFSTAAIASTITKMMNTRFRE
jgi:hypothetical protein